MSPLKDLDHGFDQRFLLHHELTAQLRAWHSAFPELTRLSSLGTTPEGREIWLFTVGRDPDRDRPSVWVDGNMHATELCGSSVALGIARDVLALHSGEVPEGLSDALRRSLSDVRFFILPRMSPDGAEAVMTTGRFVRSTPRDDRSDRAAPRWTAGDVNGDGLALTMRVADPLGEYVESREVPGLMVGRTVDDDGPYYKLYPEGTIANFDGHTVPTPHYLSDNRVDLNRNFPYGWAPEHTQVGAGAFPTSEPESRAVVEFTSRHPEIFAWLNLHTFGGVFIRPLGDKPDAKMNQADLAIFRQIGAWAEELTGYPMVSGFEEFTYEPDTPLYGDLTEYAYHQRGAIAYVVELWDLFEQLGLPKQKRFVDRYVRISPSDMKRIHAWDAEQNHGRIFRPWVPFPHPQLGLVELGGIDIRVGISNPPFERLPELVRQHSACFLRVAALAPRVEVSTTVERRGEVATIVADVRNAGYLGTEFLPSAKALVHNEPLWMTCRTEGCELLDPKAARQKLGHLDGWGRGLYPNEMNLFLPHGRGSTGRAVAAVSVRGRGRVELRVGSCRVGHQVLHVEV